MKITLIAAVSKNMVIGKNGHLIYNEPEDMDHFKKTTMGHIVVMGRKTWDSIPDKYKPLTGRLNIIITRNTKLKFPSTVLVFHDWQSVKDWVMANKPESEIFVAGGGEIYTETINDASRLILSEFDREETITEGTVLFPKIPSKFSLRVIQNTKKGSFKFKFYNA